MVAALCCACRREPTPAPTRLPLEPSARPAAVASASASASSGSTQPAHINCVLLVLQASLAPDAHDAVERVVMALGPSDLVGLVAYADEPVVVAKLDTPNAQRVDKALSSVVAKPGAALASALRVAHAELKAADSLGKYTIVVAANKSDDAGAETEVKTMFTEWMGLSTIGVGNAVAGKELAQLAKLGGGRYVAVASAAKLETALQSEIAAVLGP